MLSRHGTRELVLEGDPLYEHVVVPLRCSVTLFHICTLAADKIGLYFNPFTTDTLHN